MTNEIISYSRCKCGAITIYFKNGAANSMRHSTFKKIKKEYGIDLRKLQRLPKSYCCDHCVNHYGIDVCECGSGCKVGKCPCGSNKAHDEFGVKFDSIGAITKGFTMLL